MGDLTPDEIARLNALRDAITSKDPAAIRAAMAATGRRPVDLLAMSPVEQRRYLLEVTVEALEAARASGQAGQILQLQRRVAELQGELAEAPALHVLPRARGAEPGRPEVLGWMSRTGRTTSEAVDHFWPGVAGSERVKVAARVRKWAQLAREARAPDAPPRAQDGAVGADNRDRDAGAGTSAHDPPRPEADYETARLERVAFLEWHLAELLADLKWVRTAGLVGRISTLASQVSEVRLHLDTARGEGRPVTLERSPGAVAEELERRGREIAQLAAARQRARERDL